MFIPTVQLEHSRQPHRAALPSRCSCRATPWSVEELDACFVFRDHHGRPRLRLDRRPMAAHTEGQCDAITGHQSSTARFTWGGLRLFGLATMAAV
jgi:hypothetical protein